MKCSALISKLKEYRPKQRKRKREYHGEATDAAGTESDAPAGNETVSCNANVDATIDEAVTVDLKKAILFVDETTNKLLR